MSARCSNVNYQSQSMFYIEILNIFKLRLATEALSHPVIIQNQKRVTSLTPVL